MKIQNQRINRTAKWHFCCQLVCTCKSVFIFRHKQIGHNIHHAQPLPLVIFNNHMTGAWKSRVHIFRTQQARLPCHIGAYLGFIKRMITCG